MSDNIQTTRQNHIFYFKQKHFRMILLCLFLILGQCGTRVREYSEGEKALLFFIFKNGGTINSSYTSGCSGFWNSEQLCIKSPDSLSSVCSDSELTRVKNGIEPSDKRTDKVLEAFYNCWMNCNLIFNASDSDCLNAKLFSTTKSYRDAQKAAKTQSSLNWGFCVEKCNSGKSNDPILIDAAATYPKPAY